MSRQLLSRESRVTQMKEMEEYLAKKKREILEKQKNAEIVKVLSENMTKKSTTESADEITKKNTAAPSSSSTSTQGFRNSFDNDGTFLENFKKVSEAANILQSSFPKNEDENAQNPSSIDANNFPDSGPPENSIENQQSDLYPPHLLLPSSSLHDFSHAFPPPLLLLQHTSSPLSFMSEHQSVIQKVSQSPPNVEIELNEIPAPKDLDLNAIPKPELNLNAIKIPPECPSQEKLELIPKTIESLIDAVVEHGEAFEDKLRQRQQHEVDSSLFFIFSKESDAYQSYRQKIIFAKAKKSISEANKKYDPSEIYNNKNDDECNGSDSDYEYHKEAKERNLINMKRKLTTRRNEYYSSDSDDDDEELDDRYRRKRGHDMANDKESESSDSKSSSKTRVKKSRWGDKVPLSIPIVQPTTSSSTIAASNSFDNQPKPQLRLVTRTDPHLLNYARQNFGTTELTEEDWNKAEEHYKINLLYQDMLKKREEIDRLAKSGKFKYEYDSDEDTTGGTWEHKLRSAEMEATQVWAEALNKQSEGKHHIGDFLPPEELKKFMEQYDAKKNNREPDLSDYKEYKLKEDNIGFQMLQKLGWKEGQGLGAGGSGIVEPVNKASQRDMNEGLGAASTTNPEEDDNEYDAYRKRMCLAYRFRPNPLNNPRRAYY